MAAPEEAAAGGESPAAPGLGISLTSVASAASDILPSGGPSGAAPSGNSGVAGSGAAPQPPASRGSTGFGDGRSAVLLTGVRTHRDYWQLSTLLSEQAVATAGVDVIFCQEDVYDGDDGGCLLALTQRRLPQLSWSREEDNRLRELRTRRAAQEELSEAEQAQLAELEPRFEQFESQGVAAMGELEVSVYVGWLPYGLLMALNPGLLSAKGRKAVDTLCALPSGSSPKRGDGRSSPSPPSPDAKSAGLPEVWGKALLVPAARLCALRKGGGLIQNKTITLLYYPRQEARRMPRKASVSVSARSGYGIGSIGRRGRGQLGIEFDDTGTITKVAADSPAAEAGLQEGNRIAAVAGRGVSSRTEALKAIGCSEEGEIDLEVEPSSAAGPYQLRSGGGDAFLQEVGPYLQLQRHPKNRNHHSVSEASTPAAK
eukprot:TRINITY_DN5944_c0_g1_i1.p1 TRINITY_DN5944_c0_g1~~TRINITY_DN5944_c0_g1_i1.p1  ORF type:complete len:457 (+),score=163.01 TRINITY_DN5944_c0_g1_i1:88-1371(+)